VSDIFQEVEEDVRRERYEEIWKKYGNHIIALAAVIVVAVGAWQFWQRYELSRRQELSDKYEAALILARSGDAVKAEEALSGLVKDATGGYAAIVKFELATAMMAQGKRDPAVALLRELVQEPDPLISNPARLRLAWTIADAAPKPEIASLTQPLMAADSPWRFAAAEVIAYMDLTQGSRGEALAQYEKLSQETGAPPSLRSRATAIANYIKANPADAQAAASAVPAPASAPAATPTPPPAQRTNTK
jgi:hypothetical protein